MRAPSPPLRRRRARPGNRRPAERRTAGARSSRRPPRPGRPARRCAPRARPPEADPAARSLDRPRNDGGCPATIGTQRRRALASARLRRPGWTRGRDGPRDEPNPGTTRIDPGATTTRRRDHGAAHRTPPWRVP
jgi:hypothetical protein